MLHERKTPYRVTQIMHVALRHVWLQHCMFSHLTICHGSQDSILVAGMHSRVCTAYLSILLCENQLPGDIVWLAISVTRPSLHRCNTEGIKVSFVIQLLSYAYLPVSMLYYYFSPRQTFSDGFCLSVQTDEGDAMEALVVRNLQDVKVIIISWLRFLNNDNSTRTPY